MIRKSAPAPIRVALLGMDPRSRKTMELYLKGPCQGIAVIDDINAEIDILDADYPTAGEILKQRTENQIDRPIILMSLEKLDIPNTHFLQKPVKAAQLVETLIRIRPKPAAAKAKNQFEHLIPHSQGGREAKPTDADSPNPKSAAGHAGSPPNQASVPVKRRSAIEMNEGGYTGFLGTLAGIDFNDPTQLENAYFEPKRFFLGFVQSAYKVARAEARSLRLQSMWKPLFIYPATEQIWVDADEKHLRVMAGIEQNKNLNSYVSLVPFDINADLDERAKDRFQNMDAFLWKLAIWTSKGRLPSGLNPQHPVFLKYWPNFTRLMITPDAMRIAALLAYSPRTPLDIVRDLNVRAEYVFAFIAACHAIGILDQSSRHADELVKQPEKAQSVKKHGLFSKILSKLRGE